MKNNNESGFSLIELLIVVVIGGIVAALAVPAFQRGIVAAENRNIHATLKTMKSTQAMFFSKNQRFARLDELNQLQQGGFGTMSGNALLLRNGFSIEMSPTRPTDSELKEGYLIGAYRQAMGVTWRFELTNEGLIRVLPVPEDFD